jgi:hypothetical protein
MTRNCSECISPFVGIFQTPELELLKCIFLILSYNPSGIPSMGRAESKLAHVEPRDAAQ